MGNPSPTPVKALAASVVSVFNLGCSGGSMYKQSEREEEEKD